MTDLDYSPLPAHMQDGFRLYIEKGIPMGSFGRAFLSNDLMGAFNRADETNRASMFDLCVWLHNRAPIGCHGSPERVDEWIQAGGLEGINND
ncbi:hypothetical protein [Ruegeria sp. EL01]|uniref:hypothetical protein n=1 Tax=Ruegeria sp. EL01 TaxID=2107578 RepID=UPI0013C42736|nr:hypothetical protein [Ruegeria sp. EL01]